MNTIKKVNRLFLAMVCISLVGGMLIGPLIMGSSLHVRMLASQLLYLLPVMAYVLIAGIDMKREIPFRKIKISTVFMVILFAALCMPLMQWMNMVSMLFVENHIQSIAVESYDAPFLLNLLVIAVVPALSEEFMFRGIFYGAYKRRGLLFGAIACGVLFGLLHMNLNQFFYAASLGFVMCVLMEATGSILATMLFHFVINGWSVIVLELQKLLSGWLPEVEAVAESSGDVLTMLGTTGFLVLSAWAFITAALAGCTLIWIARHCKREEVIRGMFSRKEQREEPVEKKVFYPAIIIAIGICLIYVILLG